MHLQSLEVRKEAAQQLVENAFPIESQASLTADAVLLLWYTGTFHTAALIGENMSKIVKQIHINHVHCTYGCPYYDGSTNPMITSNDRMNSIEQVAMIFFLFAVVHWCIANLYVYLVCIPDQDASQAIKYTHVWRL